jgi:hypothetical protein
VRTEAQVAEVRDGRQARINAMTIKTLTSQDVDDRLAQVAHGLRPADTEPAAPVLGQVIIKGGLGAAVAYRWDGEAWSIGPSVRLSN